MEGRNDDKSDDTRSRKSSGENNSQKKISQRMKIRLGESGEGDMEWRNDDEPRIKLRLGKKVDGDRRRLGKEGIKSDEMLFDLEKFQGSTDEESLDILEKMKRKNEKRLR